ncbi:MAG: hypothetical protein U0413_02000 [Candidatus Saccharimonadales bacterium]
MQTTKLKDTKKRKTTLIVISLFALVGTIVLAFSKASSMFISLEAENGTRTGNVTIAHDDSA